MSKIFLTSDQHKVIREARRFYFKAQDALKAGKWIKAITVMYKVAGYNPDAGDWFWAKFSPEGKADKFGKPNGCVGCHGTRAKNDFILVHEFK